MQRSPQFWDLHFRGLLPIPEDFSEYYPSLDGQFYDEKPGDTTQICSLEGRLSALDVLQVGLVEDRLPQRRSIQKRVV